jgi:CheY-like chemotaxis protein
MDVAQAVAGEIEAGANQIANARLLSGLRVLLVEDNSFDRFVLGRTLASWDVTCEVAATLREALTTLKGADIGAVLLNVRLAEGDVAAAASALLNAGSREPGQNAAPAILALLPSTWDKGSVRPGDGILDVVPKPVDPSVLFAKLAAVRP